MLTHYPTKRSVLVPTLLYAQDEIGFLSDEAIAEIAARLDLTDLEVRNVISYYSMLTTKPRGKYFHGQAPPPLTRPNRRRLGTGIDGDED